MAAFIYNSQLDAFTLYHLVHEHESKKSIIGPALPALGHATSGASGTAISKVLTYPLDLVITRLQVQRQFQTDDEDEEYAGILDAVEKIYRKEGGVRAFYSGVVPETLKGIVDSFLFFLAYTYIGQKRRSAVGSKRLSALDEIGVGVLSGAFSKFCTTPLQNVVTRKQAAAMIASRSSLSSISPGLSLKDIALQIRDEKGLQGFWSGYSASLILTLNPSITFLLHKVLLRVVVPKERRADPGAQLTFLLAAVSKAMASTITYPFSLAKTRAQVSSQKPTERSGPTSEVDKQNIASETAAARARQRTVFSTILRIAQTEGLAALYQGLGAEVLKGFFSHGITMLMKDRIHNMIINLYYLILKSLKEYPSPEELAKLAAEQAKVTYDQSRERVEVAYVKGMDAAGVASTKVQEVVASSSHQAEELLEKGREVARNATSEAKEALNKGVKGQ